MALPKLNQPIFELTLPSTGKKLQYRQFTVKEEKILLTVQSSDDKRDIIRSIKQLVQNCCVDEIDVGKLASVDLEYFFVQLRAKSVSDVVDLEFGDEDRHASVQINLDDVKVHHPEVSNRIVLDEENGIGVVLRYPTFELIERLQSSVDTENPESVIDIIKVLIESVFDMEQVWDDLPDQELDEFVMSMNTDQVQKIQEFVNDLPYIYIDVTYKYDGEEEEHTERVRGIDSFFG